MITRWTNHSETLATRLYVRYGQAKKKGRTTAGCPAAPHEQSKSLVAGSVYQPQQGRTELPSVEDPEETTIWGSEPLLD